MRWRCPIQALTLRSKEQIEQQNNPPGSVHAAALWPRKSHPRERKRMTCREFSSSATRKRYSFRSPPGLPGTTDIEVLDGLKEGDEVITGSYKVLRTLRPGSGVKIDNTVPKKEDEES